MPVRRSASAHALAPSNAIAAWRPSSTTKSLPRPCILRNGILPISAAYMAARMVLSNAGQLPPNCRPPRTGTAYRPRLLGESRSGERCWSGRPWDGRLLADARFGMFGGVDLARRGRRPALARTLGSTGRAGLAGMRHLAPNRPRRRRSPVMRRPAGALGFARGMLGGPTGRSMLAASVGCRLPDLRSGHLILGECGLVCDPGGCRGCLVGEIRRRIARCGKVLGAVDRHVGGKCRVARQRKGSGDERNRQFVLHDISPTAISLTEISVEGECQFPVARRNRRRISVCLRQYVPRR